MGDNHLSPFEYTSYQGNINMVYQACYSILCNPLSPLERAIKTSPHPFLVSGTTPPRISDAVSPVINPSRAVKWAIADPVVGVCQTGIICMSLPRRRIGGGQKTEWTNLKYNFPSKFSRQVATNPTKFYKPFWAFLGARKKAKIFVAFGAR